MEACERKYQLEAGGGDLNYIAEKAAEIVGIDPDLIWKKGKQRKVVKARSLLCYWATNDLGVSQSALSKRLEMAPSAIGLSVLRGRELVRKNHYRIM